MACGIPAKVFSVLPFPGSSSTFELEKLKLQMQGDLELDKLKHELASKRELELEKQRQELAFKKELEFGRMREELAFEGEKWKDRTTLLERGDVDVSVLDERVVSPQFDVGRNLRILPKLTEKDLDTFFIMFERLAHSCKWPEEDQVILLQSVLVGKAQEAYSSLSPEHALSYKAVKEAILKAYELVPEAYRLKFRTWKLQDRQSHVEFAREMTLHFERWRNAAGANNYESLCDLMALERFKNSVSENVSTYITERKASTGSEAAVLADEYVLIRKGKDVRHEYRVSDSRRRDSRFHLSKPHHNASHGSSPFAVREVAGTDGRFDPTRICHVCRSRGH